MNKLFLLSMIFILVLFLVMVSSVLAGPKVDIEKVGEIEVTQKVPKDEPESNAVLVSDEVGPDTLKFIPPYQNTGSRHIFKVGDPLWMYLFINVDKGKKVIAYYVLFNIQTREKKLYDAAFDLPQGGNWRINLGWEKAPDELKGIWSLVGIVVSGLEKAICPKPWVFIVK